jgi:mxaC protein
VQDQLRDAVTRSRLNLYWLFLRSKGSRGIFEPPSPGEPDSPQANPERHLHLFLSSLGTSYRAFQATSPQAVEQAIAEIDKHEKRRITYLERVPRRDLAGLAYAVAAGAVSLLMLAKLAERNLADGRAQSPAPAGTDAKRGVA